ncbi:MAG: hypothetical protein IJT81_08730 [Lachnospiraceae bacterium]|nr:hypothetical protein [Lachnospiraceae bacterium]
MGYQNIKRYRSIDIMRGLSMIVVLGIDKVIRKAVEQFNINTLLFLSEQMNHSEFGACLTIEDFPMPTLVFLSGATIPLSLERHIDKSWKYKALIVLKRVGLLLLFSLIYNSSVNRSLGVNTLTMAGVLGVFAVA